MTRFAAILLSILLATGAAAFADQRDDFNAAMGLVEAGEYETAAGRLQSLAEQGHAGAQFNLGFLYEAGRGVDQDFFAAFNWYRLAAAQQFPDAEFKIGVMYYLGRGVEKDVEQAIEWYRRAAEQGYGNAQTNLAFAYQTGDGVEQDKREAVAWYRKAAEQGSMKAQFNLGFLYLRGDGVDRQLVDAYKWFTLAAIQGHEQATRNRELVMRKMSENRLLTGDSSVRGYLETHPAFVRRLKERKNQGPPQ